MGAIRDLQQLSNLLVHRGPVILMRDADAGGVSRALIRRSLDSGTLTRLGKAAFVQTEVFAAADPWEAFRLRSIAFGRSAVPPQLSSGCQWSATRRSCLAQYVPATRIWDMTARPTVVPGTDISRPTTGRRGTGCRR